MAETVDFSDLFAAFEDALTSRIHVAIPAKTIKYDPATMRADCQPLVKRTLLKADGSKTFESYPPLLATPVMFPRAGGYIVTLPMNPAGGDYVLLIFPHASTAEYEATGQESEPQDATRLGVSYPYAVPGGFPGISPPSPADLLARTDGMVIGKDGAPQQIRIADTGLELGANAVDFVALASLVLAQLNEIITAFNSHTHPLTASGSAGSVAGNTTAPTTSMPPAGAVAATLVKAL